MGSDVDYVLGNCMKVLIACEFSGIVRRAFRSAGHCAWSCDLFEPAEDGSEFHFMKDAVDVSYGQHWDMMIAHPPCTHLAVSGARHFREKRKSGVQQEAVAFVQKLMSAPIEKIAIENPISIISTAIRKPDQIIHPWQFGHPETKATCLWLKNLPLIVPEHIVDGREARIHRMPPSPTRWKERSRTYQGIANAFANQWGNVA